MIQSLSNFLPKPPDLLINDTRVESADSIIYLGVLVNGSCSSSDEISRRLVFAQSPFGQLRNYIWRSRLKEKTKIQLYGTYILPILLYGSETWTPNQRDIDRTNAFGQRCLRSICDIHWSEHKTNEYILKCTNQVPISCTIKKRRLKLLGHVARFPDSADTTDALIHRLPKHWKRQRGRPQDSWSGTVEKDLKPHNMGLHAARKLAKDREKCSKFVHGATLPP